MYLISVQMIFWMDFTSNAEMSHPKQFHVSRPKCNGVFFNNDAHATFF